MFDAVADALDRREWTFLLGVWIPTALWMLGLKALRMWSLPELGGANTVLQLIRSDLFALLALLALGISLLRFAHRLPRLRWLPAAGYQALAALAVVVNGLAHLFYMSTGSVLSWDLIQHGWTHFSDVDEVVASELAPWQVAIVALGAFVVLVLPWGLMRWRDVSDEASASGSRHPTAVALVLAGVSIGIAALPAGWLESGTGFAREPTLHVALSALSSPEPTDSTDVEEVPTFDAPVGTEFVETDRTRRKNVVFIILESTGANATTIHEPDLKTTPYLDRLADESLDLRQAYTLVPHTSKALTTIHCGIPPRLTMATAEAVPGALPATCLPDLLERHDYRTIFFQSAESSFEDRRALVDNFGFETFRGPDSMPTEAFERTNYLGYDEAIMLDPSRQWLQSHDDRPFFATYLTLSPHHDYGVPSDHESHSFVEGDVQNRYLNAVHHVDGFVERLVRQYKELGLYEETIFFVFGDHGEAFGEHGRWQHDNVLYQEVAKVPWLIYDPSRSGEEGRLKRPVQLFDLVPTVADTLGYRIRGGDYPGRSVFRRGEPRTLFFSCFYQARCLGAFHGGYKYHYHYGTRPEELFYLPEDPGETTNLADEQPKRTASFRHAVLQWEKSVEKMYKRAMEDELRGRVGREKPSLEHTGRASLGASVSIVGYELEPDPPRAGSTARVRVAYHARSAPARDRMLVYTLRIGDRTEQLENHRPLDGLHPVSQWETGQYVVDEVEIDLPKEASGQTVSLAITLVEPGGDTGEKHPKTGIGGPVGGRNYQGVARVKLWDRQLGE